MRSKLSAILVSLVLACSASLTLAAPAQNDDETPPDARLEGYTHEGGGTLIITPASGSAGTWIMIVVLGALLVGVMCKDGKRTHLD